jgi:hypothetical protein
VIAYVRSRKRVWSAAGLLAGVLLTTWNVLVPGVAFLREYAVRNDLRLAYAAAMVGIQDGYSHLYDLAAQRVAILSLGPDFNPQPFISPPPLAWLVTPLLAIPFPAALAIWTAILIAALVWSWYLLAPPGSLTKAAHLALWLGLFPVAYGVIVGQPGPLVAAAVATSWWLLRRNRPVWAGVALSVLVIKPQLALLVPVCLLVSGHVRTFGAWLVVCVFLGLASLALLGPDGIARYREVLALTQTPDWDITRRYAVSGLIGLGPQVYVVGAAVAAAALIVAWRHRGGGPEVPIVAGIVGSLLFTPYLAFQDFLMLVVAGWLLLRAHPSPWQVALLVAGYALLELSLIVLALPILVGEALLLISLVWLPAPQLERPLNRRAI